MKFVAVFCIIVRNTLYVWEKSWGSWLWNITVGKQIAKIMVEQMIKTYAIIRLLGTPPSEDALKKAIMFILSDMGAK